MKKLSEQFLEMSKRTAKWEERAATRTSDSRQALEGDVAEARTSVKSAQTSFDAKLDSIEESVSSQWRKVQESHNEQVDKVRTSVAERKAAHNLADARARADDFEAYAEAAAEFAALAAVEADLAMLQAVEARIQADDMASMTK